MKRAFIHGKFYRNAGQFAEAVLVQDGIFVAIGSNAEICAMAGDADIVDLGGRIVLPGFNDSHLHLYNTGVMLGALRLGACTSISACIEAGKAYIKKNQIPPGRAILGHGWNQDYFTDETRLLTRHDLDQISQVHPIVAFRACIHAVCLNSFALQQAGITRETAEIEGGEIHRDEQGEPTGILTENAIKLVHSIEQAPTVEEMTASLNVAIAHANQHGITSVQVNDIHDDNAEDMLNAYAEIFKQGTGTVRVYHQCRFSDADGIRAFANAGHKTGFGNNFHKIGPIKCFVDGSLGARTAWMRNPYHDAPHTRGVLCLTQAQLDQMVQTAHEAGFQCVIHAIGDAAMDMVLESYERVIENGENVNRHGIIHCQITDLPLLKRFKKSNILALVQPVFLHYDIQIVEQRVGVDLAMTSYAFHTMDQLGIPVCYSTDAPIEDLNPFHNIHCAVNRQDFSGNPVGGYNARECVSLERTIDNYTLGSAYASFEENKKGRIQVGFLADMCVLDRDIFAIDSAEIIHVQANMTILGGEIVFARS